MKRALFFLFLLYFSAVLYAQNQALVCRLGFDYEISYNDYWGLNRPVVKSVHTGSPAEKAGLKVNDIIERIGDIETRTNYSEKIFAMLQEEKFINLTISNLAYKNKEIVFSKHCDLLDAISEEQMISAFSSYSLENVWEKELVCPFKTVIEQSSEVNYLNYKTFGFLEETKPVALQENLGNYMNDLIKQTLENRGLAYQQENPDFFISVTYTCRKKENNVENDLTLTIRFVDMKHSAGKTAGVIWECTANETLAGLQKINDYANINIPLMLMQYPYPQTFENARFRYRKKKFNYTGINYDVNDFRKITYVDPVSPASQAGIETGDMIRKINGAKTERGTKYNSSFAYLFHFESTNKISFDIKRGKEQLSIEIEPIITEYDSFENY